MSNPIYERLQQRGQPSGPQLTELGDPDYSPSTSSQGQVPGAAAQARIFDNQRRAENMMAQAQSLGYDITDPEWEPILEQAQSGIAEPKRPWIENLVGWVDGPRQAVNLLIQDLTGGEAEEGFRNPNFGDYWNTLWGGVEDQEGFKLETGLNPISGSETLDMFGWMEADDDDTFGRIMRGVADFGLQVATDPLSYVTFGLSGLGKKVALSTGQRLQKESTRRILQHVKGGKVLGDKLTPYEEMLASNLDEITGVFQDRLVAKAGQFGGELPPEMQSALSRYFGRSEDVWENITEAALANRIHDDVIRPLVGRRFDEIDKLALDMLPAYAKGGARISIPFTQNTLSRGYLIPGSQGLGRKMVGDPLRRLSTQMKAFGPYEKLANAMTQGVTKMDQMAPLLRALKNGDIEGWQWSIAATAVDNMHNNVARHTISTELNSQWNRLSGLASESGVELDVIGADILARLEGDNVSDELLAQMGRDELVDGEFGYRALNPNLAASVDETVTYMQQVMGSYHEALSALDPTFKEKFIDGYIPHSPTKESRQIITALARSGAGESGQGDTAADLVAQILNAAGRGGTAETNMGTVRHVGRKVGRVSATQLTDDGVIQVDKETLRALGDSQPLIDPTTGAVNPNAVETRYLSTTELNRLLEPIVRRMAHEEGVPLPKNWDGKLFNENPMDAMLDYVGNMTDAINAWQTVDLLKASGLAFKHQTELDVQQVVQNMFNNAVRNASLMETTHFGRPRQGQTEKAPTSWLRKLVDPEDYDGAVDDVTGAAVSTAQKRSALEAYNEAGRNARQLTSRERRHLLSALEDLRRAYQDDITDPEMIPFMSQAEAETIASGIPDVTAEIEQLKQVMKGDKSYEGFVDDVASVGVQEPVKLSVLEDGRIIVLDGHHRIAAAEEAGVADIPYQIRRDTTDLLGGNVEYGEDVGDFLKAGWYDQGGARGGLSAEQDQLARKARSNWNYTAETLRPEVRKILSGEGSDNERAHALVAWWRESNEPVEGLVRALNQSEIDELSSKNVGDVVDLDMASSDVGGKFAAGARGEGWTLEFDEPTLAARNELNQIEAARGGDEWLVSGKFTVKSVDEETRTVRVGSQQVADELQPAAADAPFDNMTTYEAEDVFDTLPYGPEVKEELSLLRGAEAQSGIAGVTRSVKTQIDDSGVIAWKELEDVADTRRVVNKVNSSHYTEWSSEAPTPDMRVSQDPESTRYVWETHTDDEGVLHQVFEPEQLDEVGKERAARLREKQDTAKKARAQEARREGKTPPKLRISARKATENQEAVFRVAPYEHLNMVERNNVWRAAHNWLDRAFREGGEFDGMFTDAGIQSIIDSGLDEYSAQVLHSYVHTKVNSLGRDAVEFISKEPAEVFQTRALFDSWAQGINDFVRNAGAVRTVDGKLIADTDKLQLAGTKEVRDQLAGLKRAAMELGDRGYDTAVAVMQDVEAYTGVQKLKDYVNPGHYNLAGPAVEDLTIQQNVAEWMSLTARNMGTIYTPEGVAAAKLAANQALKWWRAMATLPRPAFHIRNLVGGSWMNMNFGVTSSTMSKTSRYGLAFRKALGEASGAEGIEQAFNRLPKEMQMAWREAWDHNVLAGFATTEFSNAVTPAGARKRWDWAKVTDVDNFVLTRAGGKVMESVEDFLRMSLFLEYYDEAVPGSAKVAADMVNAVHFDYSNLTPTETKLKSVIPFFVWTRRNLPLQVATAVENPRYVQRYRAMMQAMDDNLGGDDPENLQEADYMSAWAAGTDYKVNPGTPFWARIMIDPDLPIHDMLEIPNPEPGAVLEYANNILGPHVSALVDVNSQRDFGDVNAPAPFNAVLQGLASVGLYDRTLDGDVRIPYLMRTLMETGVPFTRDIVDPLTGGPTDPKRQQRLGIEEDDGFLESSLKNVGASLIGGAGIKMTTPADTRAAAYRSDAELDELIRSLRLEGKAPPIDN